MPLTKISRFLSAVLPKPILSHSSLSTLHKACYFCLRQLKSIDASQPQRVSYYSEECRQQVQGFHDIEMIADWSAYHDYCRYTYVVIRGNTKTKEYLIEAELEGIRKATTMQELLEASAKANSKLKELDIFDSVQITLDSGPQELPRTANVLIDVVETECDYW